VAERGLFQRLKAHLESERPLREMELTEEERRGLRGYALLSGKPMLLVVNLDEARLRDAAGTLAASGLPEFAARRSWRCAPSRRRSRRRSRSWPPRTRGRSWTTWGSRSRASIG